MRWTRRMKRNAGMLAYGTYIVYRIIPPSSPSLPPSLPSSPLPSPSHRNESRSAQVLAWTLATLTLLLTIILIAFMGILLAGNGLVSTATAEGRVAVSKIIPAVVQVRDSAVAEVMETVRGKYVELLQKAMDNVR